MPSYEEACAAVTAPGAPFEVVEADVSGSRRRIFLNAPRSLREVVGGASARGEGTFLVYEDERWSFDRFGREVAGFAAALVDRYGVRDGDRVAIAMRNYPEWIVAYGATVSIGAIAVSFNAWWTADEMDFALHDCGAAVLVADRERCERSRSSCDSLGIPTVVVRHPDAAVGRPDGGATGDTGARRAGIDAWSDVVDPDAPMPLIDVDPDDDATILYTSGTTGLPKGAVSTHRAVVQAVMGYACRSAVDRARDPNRVGGLGAPSFILVVPLFHVTGCVPVMLGCMAGGLKLVMMYRWQPERALELIERERITNFVGVPTQNIDLLNSQDFARRDTSSLRSVGGGGAPTPPELVQRIATSYRGAAPGIGYGMTETNAYGPQNSGEDYLARPTSAGRVTPIMAVEVRDALGVAVADGELGEIWFNGPNLIRGYWNRPDATDEAIVDGWLRTGDLGYLDDDGFVHVVDRIKDVVLRGGENVYCAEVEAALHEHPAVHEVAVFGVPEERLGEEVAAVVRIREGSTVDAGELLDHLDGRLAAFKIPSRMRLTDEPLPRNAAGKHLKRELRDAEIRLRR